MREDFKKLLCERERRNRHWYPEPKGLKKARQKDESGDYEDWAPGAKVSMKKDFFGESRKTKELNENLSPLLNFLKANIGRKWDDVYSEIKKACPSEGAVNAHIYQHLFGFVETNAIIKNGIPYTPPHQRFSRYGGFKDEELYRLYGYRPYTQFYVDEKGLLQVAPTREKYKVKDRRTENERRLYLDRWAVKMDGHWFWLFLKPIPVPVERLVKDPTGKSEEMVRVLQQPSYEDLYLPYLRSNGLINLPSYSFYYFDKLKKEPYAEYVKLYGRKVYCWKIQQMNSRDIQKHSLNK